MTERMGGITNGGHVADQARSILTSSAETIRATGAEFGRTTAHAIDTGREAVAKRLGGAAAGLHGGADLVADRGAQMSSAAHGTADAIESAAQYVRDRKPRAVWADLMGLVKAHPGASLLAVLAVGYVVGRAMPMHRE